jgi:flagellar L-ring protein precursor FlgH
MKQPILPTLVLALLSASPATCGLKLLKQKPPSPLDQYLAETLFSPAAATGERSPGSLYSAGGLGSNLLRDLRAFQKDDIITIVVSDSASAVSKGVTSSSRKSSVSTSVSSLFKVTNPSGALANMAGASNDQQLAGQGTTSRENTVSTTLSARVIAVAPNGNLVVEGVKRVRVNSEDQLVRVRGVVRPVDIGSANTVASNQLAMLEVDIDGKGVVNDAVRRPFFLYRLLLGLLPF